MITDCFHDCFFHSYQTKLLEGNEDPLYIPATQTSSGSSHIEFANGFWSSALHEVAHWCLAGPKRRTMVDYGYWYKPDGRNADEQKCFEAVEVKPQALEWIFTSALGEEFFISLDNLNNHSESSLRFKHKVFDQVQNFFQNGLPPRGATLLDRLIAKGPLSQLDFEDYWQQTVSLKRLPS